MPASDNPFARRLERLYAQWDDFASDRDARVLRWLITPEELRLIDAFVATEQHDEGGTLPVLFVRCNLPFSAQWGLAVRNALIDMQATSIERGELAGANAWKPGPVSGDDRHAAFEAMMGIHAALGGLAEQVVLVAVPQSIDDVQLWNAWLADFAKRTPSEARCVVVDMLPRPQLDPLAEHGAKLVMTREAGLDVPGATAELAAARGSEKPDDRFRQLFIAMGAAAGKSDLGQVRKLGDQALTLTREQRWPQLEVVVYMVLGNTAVQAGKPVDAIPEFQAADQAAVRAAGVEGVDSPRLRLTAQLGLGSALIASQAYDQAAQVYAGAAELAEQLEDHALLLECWRMSAYCHEQRGHIDEAWRAGMYALGAGEALAGDRRQHSTLAWAGDQLMRIADAHTSYRAMGPSVDAKLIELLARRDWRALASGVPA